MVRIFTESRCRKMIAPTMEKKTASVFPATFPGAPVIYLNTYSNEGQKVYETAQAVGWLRRPLAIHRLRWSLSATWIGTTTWLPGTAQRPSRRANPLPAGRMITCVYWWRRSYPGQKKTWPVLRHGGGSLGTRWRGYSPCTPSTGRICSHG